MTTAWIAILFIMHTFRLPLGDFAMGGKYKVMPKPMRAACAVSVWIQVLAVLLLLRAGHVISISLAKGTSSIPL